MIQKIINKIKRYFGKEEIYIHLTNIGIIESTKVSIDSGSHNDIINKNIVIYESVEIKGDKIRWGKKIKEVPYTEEEVLNLEKIKGIPIVDRKILSKFKFIEGSSMGNVIN